MTEWRTGAGRGVSIGIGLITSILLVDGGLMWLAASRPLSIGTFMIGVAALTSLGLLGMIGYWVYGLARSGYVLDRNALVIKWGPAEQIIPTSEIDRVFTGDEIEGHVQFWGGAWPGHWVGYGEIPQVGQVLFYATVSPRDQIYVATPGLTYGISPTDPGNFLGSLRKRLEMGATQAVEQSSKRPRFLEWSIWQDRLGLSLLAVGSLALLALIGLLCLEFPSLPLLVPLHFDAMGRPDRLGSRGQLFFVALIGFLALLLNGGLGGLTYGRERVASYLLWAGAILMQVLVWMAAMGILARV